MYVVDDFHKIREGRNGVQESPYESQSAPRKDQLVARKEKSVFSMVMQVMALALWRILIPPGFFLGLGLIVLLEGCGTTLPKQEAPVMEKNLISAGFTMVPADTPEKLAKLRMLPPYKLVKRKSNGQNIYVYADPTNCQCAYIGDAHQYATFKRYLSSMSITESDALNARMETEEQMEEITDAWDPL